jgi:hypothetical protein
VALIPLDRDGSLVPVPHLRPGDGVVCDFFGLKVYLTLPTPEGFRDPWRGSDLARISPPYCTTDCLAGAFNPRGNR